MRRLAVVALCMSGLALACSDQNENQPGAPSPSLARPSIVATATCDPDPTQTAIQIESLINQIFTGGNLNAAMKRWLQVKTLLTAPPPQDSASAVSNTYAVIDYTLQKYSAGQLAPGATAQDVTDLVNLLYCYAGIAAVLPPLGNDGAAAVYQPGSPALLLIAPSGYGGISLPPGTGTVTVPTVISLSRIQPDFPGPLLTNLDQYPLYYEFNTSSGETFLQDAIVSVCVAENVTVPDDTRLRLAHNVPEPNFTTIEILPLATGFLDCTGAQAIFPPLGSAGSFGSSAARMMSRFATRVFEALGPEALYAATMGVTGTTGTTKNLSPFGSVDTLAFMTPLSPTSGQSAPQGGTVIPPKVLVATPTDVPMAGITVTFTVTGGGGTLTAVGSTTPVTTVVTTTDATGQAAVGSWTLGAGTNTVQAVATPPHSLSGIDPAGGITFTATGNPAVKLQFASKPLSRPAGSLFTVVILVKDAFGNTVPASNATVNLKLNASNGATLSGPTTVQAVNGVATFAGLSIAKPGTGYTLTARSTGLTSATSDAFRITVP